MNLTGRELEVINLMTEGLSSKEIAQSLQISRRTVDAYIHKIYVKTGAKNKSNAVFIFMKTKCS